MDRKVVRAAYTWTHCKCKKEIPQADSQLVPEMKHWQGLGNYKLSIRVDIAEWDTVQVTLYVEFAQ